MINIPYKNMIFLLLIFGINSSIHSSHFLEKNNIFTTEDGMQFETDSACIENILISPYGFFGHHSYDWIKTKNFFYKHYCSIAAITEYKETQNNKNNCYLILDRHGGLSVLSRDIEKKSVTAQLLEVIPTEFSHHVQLIHLPQTKGLFITDDQKPVILITYDVIYIDTDQRPAAHLYKKINLALQRRGGISNEDLKHLGNKMKIENMILYLQKNRVTIFNTEQEITDAKKNYFKNSDEKGISSTKKQ